MRPPLAQKLLSFRSLAEAASQVSADGCGNALISWDIRLARLGSSEPRPSQGVQ